MRILKIQDLRAQVLPLEGCSVVLNLVQLCRSVARSGELLYAAKSFTKAGARHPHSGIVGCLRAKSGTETPTCGKQAFLACLESSFLKSFSSFVHELLLDFFWSTLILFARSELSSSKRLYRPCHPTSGSWYLPEPAGGSRHSVIVPVRPASSSNASRCSTRALKSVWQLVALCS